MFFSKKRYVCLPLSYIFGSMIGQIKISDYTYSLPQHRIALFPLEQRDKSKLLVYDKGRISHRQFTDLPEQLPEHSLLVFNNTKVIQARILFEKESGATIEIFLLHPVKPSSLLLETMQSSGSCEWKCTIGNVKRWKPKTTLRLKSGGYELAAELINKEEGLVKFSWDGAFTFAEIVTNTGLTPLPPYLKRKPEEQDKDRYQTVYSAAEGAVAAPTAGLHFTDAVFKALEAKKIKKDFVTLHVSAGTFQPVKEENAVKHTMHQEQILVSRSNVLNLLDQNGPVICVGTTSMRTVESLYWYGVKLMRNPTEEFVVSQGDAYTLDQEISPKEALTKVLDKMIEEQKELLVGETSIYIMPGYRCRLCTGLITNFHQPGSTLILLVAAFIGDDWKKVYEEALTSDYRFLSYGDSSLLLP
jgi:S-adenosylmethionine:tRNA ribosyltransferase-isomerase